MIIVNELWQAMCRLSRRRGYALLAVSVLGVGLGVLMFVSGLLYQMLLRPLPFPQQQRLVAMGYASGDGQGLEDLSAAEYFALLPSMPALQASGAYAQQTVDLDNGDGAVPRMATRMSASILPMLGVTPLLGRAFSADDDRPGAPLVVLLGERVWRERFAGDAQVIGRRLKINGAWATVVGVLPASVGFPYVSQLWLPLRTSVDSSMDVSVMGRLRAGVDIDQARAQWQARVQAAGATLRGTRQGRRFMLQPLAYRFVNPGVRGFIRLMAAAALMVLLLAVANVANLQWVQALQREREWALRGALGASGARLALGAWLESALLSAGALLLALLLTQVAFAWFVGSLTANSSAPPYYLHFAIDTQVWLTGCFGALLVAVLIGAFPAWRLARLPLQASLRDGERGGSGGAFARAAGALVIVEIALTVVLLIAAGTFVQGLQRVLDQPGSSGADPTQVLTARVHLRPALYPDAAAREAYFRQLTARMRALPGVVDASVGNTIPDAELGSHEFVAAAGQARNGSAWPRAQLGIVDEAFARTYGLRLVAGRFFQPQDRQNNGLLAVIDQRLAQQLWPGQSALGQWLVLHPEDPNGPRMQVIGVVATLHLDAQLEQALPSVLMPLWQSDEDAVYLAVRTRGSALAAMPALRRAAQALDIGTPLYLWRSQAQAMQTGRIKLTILIQLFGALGSVALLLAAAGLYGVLSFSVARRTREIGIRRAVGASDARVIRQIGMQLARQLGWGLLLGTLVALPWSALLANAQLHTRAYDPAVFMPVLGLIVLVAAVSACLPLRRALRVDPLVALRAE